MFNSFHKGTLMHQQKAYLLIGLPGSGKSTWAKKKAKDKNTFIVSRDAIRQAMKYNYVFNFRYEDAVKDITFKMIASIVSYGFDVIIDETNVKRKRRLDLVQFLKIINPQIKIFYLLFDGKNNNLANRMKEPKGYTKKQWQKVIDKMDAIKDPLTINEIQTFPMFVTDNAGKTFKKDIESIRKFWINK